MISSHWTQRLGLSAPRLDRSIWVIGAEAKWIRSAYPAIDDALRQRTGFGLVLSAPASEMPTLRQVFPHEIVSPVPMPFAEKHVAARIGAALAVTIGDAVRMEIDGVPGLHVPGPEALSSEAILSLLPALPPSATSAKAHGSAKLRMIDMLGGRRILNLDELSVRLGSPQVILCLGNGPSSEDAALALIHFDCLFRVNWIWRDRGTLAEPDMVFTGDRDLPRGRRSVICFPDAASGIPILVRHTFLLHPPRAGYAFLDDLLDLPIASSSESREMPTNGARMIAAAAALQPKRLAIAGMDLYQHPGGRYPGDSIAADGYAREHGRGRDLSLIRSALSMYKGETLIISEALRTALDADPEGAN